MARSSELHKFRPRRKPHTGSTSPKKRRAPVKRLASSVYLQTGNTVLARPVKRQRIVSPVKQVEHRILVAVDFGTTYSAVSWCLTNAPDQRTVILQWPNATSSGIEGRSSQKIPTELQYVGDRVRWGFQIQDSDARHKWFKLDLFPDSTNNRFGLLADLPDRRALPPAYDLAPETLVVQYLTMLRQHVDEVLKYKLHNTVLRDTPKEFVITVPGNWPHSSQQKTRDCAIQAGFGEASKLQIVSEPEAAAIFALEALHPTGLQIGDTFVLCDCGGGTVDLISYRIAALKPILKVTEAVPGTGDICGSTIIDRYFEKFLREKFADDEQFAEFEEEIVDEAMARFQIVKTEYEGILDDNRSIPVSGLADNPTNGVRRGRFVLTSHELRTLFQPVVTAIITLVKEQIEALIPVKPKAVLLVGGFGQSTYIREAIREALDDTPIAVMQPANGWTAVVEGALMKGLMKFPSAGKYADISERRARHHYGIETNVRFQEELHDDEAAFISHCDGCLRVRVMEWFVRKNDMVKERRPIKLDLTDNTKVSRGHPGKVSVMLLSSADPNNDGPPLYKDASVRELAILEADLSPIPQDEIRQITGRNKKKYFKIEYQIQITFFSACAQAELYYKGRTYGSVNLEWL